MSQPTELPALAARWRDSEDPAARAEYLRAWSESARAPFPRALEVAARFGSQAAAEALTQDPQPPQRLLDRFYTTAEQAKLFLDWRVGFVYYRTLARYCLAWWARKGGEFGDVAASLRPSSDVADQWFTAPSDELAETALAWARAGQARAQLLEGRFEREGRSLWHLSLALAQLAHVAAPIDAGLDPDEERAPPRDVDGSLLREDQARAERVYRSRRELGEAIDGLVYAEVGPGTSPYAELSEARVAFEARAAQALVRWILQDALGQAAE